MLRQLAVTITETITTLFAILCLDRIASVVWDWHYRLTGPERKTGGRRILLPGIREGTATMKLLSKTNLKAMVLAAWKEQYKNKSHWSNDGWSKIIYDELEMLPDDATADQIAAVIGNDSWTRIECMECAHLVNEAVDFGYGENRLILCLDCLDRGMKMLLQHLGERHKK